MLDGVAVVCAQARRLAASIRYERRCVWAVGVIRKFFYGWLVRREYRRKFRAIAGPRIVRFLQNSLVSAHARVLRRVGGHAQVGDGEGSSACLSCLREDYESNDCKNFLKGISCSCVGCFLSKNKFWNELARFHCVCTER